MMEQKCEYGYSECQCIDALNKYVETLERVVYEHVRYIDAMRGDIDMKIYKRICNKFEPGLYDLEETE